jgi:hypothetical protein
MSKEYTAWELRMADRRQRGILPDQPVTEPEPTLLDDYDRLIAEMVEVVQGLGSIKVALRAKLEAASRPRATMSSGGIIEKSPGDPAEIRRLAAQLEDVTAKLASAREYESELRGMRNAAASPGGQLRPAKAVPYHDGWNITFNDGGRYRS